MDEYEGHHRFKITELTQETHKKEPVPFFQLCPPSACLRKVANHKPPRARCLKRLLGKSRLLFKIYCYRNNLSLQTICIILFCNKMKTKLISLYAFSLCSKSICPIIP